MAGFKTHITVGAGVGFFISLSTFITDWASHFYMNLVIFATAIVGSFLPDMDSDTGVPVFIVFGFYGFVASTLFFYFGYENSWSVLYLLIIPIIAFILVRYLLCYILGKYSKHRGAFHSIPAVLITFFLGLLIADFFKKLTITDKFLIAFSLSIGYLSHLVLDEIYSTQFLFSKSKRKSKGKITNPLKMKVPKLRFKKSFGTALDWNLKDKKSAIALYAILLVLVFLSYPMFRKLFFVL